jgi:adenosylcobinamide-GDP ribazoletransferase
MKGLLLAIQFLTIIPVRIRGTITERQIGRSSAFFPLVGLIQGVVVGLAVWLLSRVFPAEVVSGLAVLILIATNGGFHVDGLADTFDATAVKSSGNPVRDREKRLSVMKDSTTGAIGVTAIVLTILMKYLLISSLLRKYELVTTAQLLLLMPVFSRWTMVPVMAHSCPARNEGLGKIFVEGTKAAETILASLLMVAVFAGVVFLERPTLLLAQTGFLVVCGACLYTFSLVWARFCKWRFGGITGDTAGAAAEVADLLFLVVAFLWF